MQSDRITNHVIVSVIPIIIIIVVIIIIIEIFIAIITIVGRRRRWGLISVRVSPQAHYKSRQCCRLRGERDRGCTWHMRMTACALTSSAATVVSAARWRRRPLHRHWDQSGGIRQARIRQVAVLYLTPYSPRIDASERFNPARQILA